KRFRGNQNVRFYLVMLASKPPAGSPKPSLYFIGNEKNSVLPASVLEHAKKLLRRHHKSAFTHHWLDDYSGNCIGGHYPLKGVFQVARTIKLTRGILQRIRTTIAIGIRDPIDVANKRSETGLIGVCLAG